MAEKMLLIQNMTTTKTTRETIVKAAIRHNEKIYTGHRHALIVEEMWVKDKISVGDIEQSDKGFLTNEGEFVGRVEAANIAFKAGQIRSGISSLDSYQIFK